MKLIKKCVFLLFSIAVLLSCSREDYSSSEGTGKLSFNYIGVNTDVISTITPSRTSSLEESKPIDDYVKNGFSLNVFTHTEPIMVYQCTDYEEYKAGKCEEVELRSGSYDLITVLGNHTLEGFELPCYSDTLREVKIKNGEETSVTFNCKLSNSLLKINYTDKFKEYFSTYSSSVSTSLGNKVDYTMEEVRAAYLAPGEVTVYVTAKKEGAKEATFNVGTYKLSARYEYALTLDVDASSAKMSITFSDKLTEEPIIIDVSDAALNAAAPRFYSETMVSNELVSIIEGAVVENPLALSVNAEGLIAKCVLTTTSDYLKSLGWPENIDLVSASAEEVNKVTALGLNYKGLGTETLQLAYIDFTNVIRNLEKDKPIEIDLNVTDKFGKSTSFVVSAKTDDCMFKISPTNEEVAFLGNECKVNVSFVTGVPENIKFSLDDNNPLEVVNMEQKEDVEGLKNYLFTLKAADGTEFKNPFPVNAKYLTYDVNSENLDVAYGVLIDDEGDVWAKRAVLHVYNADMESIIIQKEEGGSWNNIDVSSIEVSGTDAIVKGLTSKTAYKFRVKMEGKEPTNIVEAETEEELQVPNSGFEEWHNKHIWTGINFVGGNVPMYSFYPYKEGEQDIWWSTKNDYTTSKAGSYSYYYVVYPGTTQLPSDWNAAAKIGYPSTPCVGNYSAEIATVGHGEGSTCTTGWLGDKMNCEKKTPGVLFTGIYQNGKENLGKAFNVRPDKMSFVYRLRKQGDESASAKIWLENRSNGEVVKVGEGVLMLSEDKKDNTNAEVKIEYTNTALKATHIVIYFTSSDSNNPSITPYYDKDNGNGNRYSRGIGNVLTVDDINLIYE